MKPGDPDRDLEGAELPLEPEAERALGEALRSAFRPAPIDPARHAEILAAALEDPLAPPSDEEIRESERLRQALEIGDERHDLVRLAGAVAAAARPTPAPEAARARARTALAGPSLRPNVIYVGFGAAALAAAAAFLVFLGTARAPEGAASAAPRDLVYSHSTNPLFDERFEPGRTSARMDRIAEARERDLRQNRYARWGAR